MNCTELIRFSVCRLRQPESILEFPLDPDKYPGSVRPPENAKLDVSFLLKGYTINGAKQMHWDKMLGSIEEAR